MKAKALLALCICSMTLAHYSDYDSKEEVQQYHFINLKAYKRESSAAVEVKKDYHKYYNSSYHPYEADEYWLETKDLLGDHGDTFEIAQDASVELDIQDLHRYYLVSPLKFNFPFYGHLISSVAITTGGFLFTGTFFHKDVIPLTQIIAPLQADFNPSLNDSATILVYNTTDRFTVQWDMVYNHDHVEDGPFTFQVSLFPNGTIYFVYKEIPLQISDINNDDHPVEVGLADSFYYDDQENRYVYEYSRIKLNSTVDLNDSAYVLIPITTCLTGGDCNECQQVTEQGHFQCAWCTEIQRMHQRCTKQHWAGHDRYLCSRCGDVNGYDRYTQEWYDSGCLADAMTTCPVPSSSAAPVMSINQESTTASTIPLTTSTLTPTPATPTGNDTSTSLARTYVVVGVSVGVSMAVGVVVLALLVTILVCGYWRHTHLNKTIAHSILLTEQYN